MVTIRKPKNALKFSKPASWWGSTWREALPAGNGVIGAAVNGGPGHDVIMINHSDLWWQGGVGVLQDVSDKLKDVRRKLDEGSAREAEHIFSNALITKGYRPQPAYPLPLCDFHVKMNLDKQVKEYARVLNMENGEVSVTFKDGATRFERSMFVSQVQNVIAYELTHAGSKAIDVTFSLDAHDKFNSRTPTAVSKVPDGVNTKYENYFMYFSARSDNGSEFGCVAFINHYGGTQTVNADSVTIKGADKVLVLLRPFIESQREKEWKSLKTALSSIKLTYEKLLREHTPVHSRLFNSAELDLDAENRDMFANDLLDTAFESGEVSPALLEKLWAYGRYLMVCGSKNVSRPLAPYGLWCGDYKAHNSAISAAGSLQTIYSHVLTGNMAEYLESVFTYYESVIDDLKKNSSRIYACRGLFIPSLIAHGTGVLGSVESDVIHFTGVAGWISRLFYDYYLYTDDKVFLKNRALPFMKETALFYENFFKVQGDSLYESSPSYSPHTTPGNYLAQNEPLRIAKNAVVDFSIARELLKNLVEGSEIAGINKPELAKWRDMLTRIPAYQFNDDNSIKEYCDSRYTDNVQSTSTAMFYPVYPGTEISGATPELKKSFEVTAKKKYAAAGKTQTSATLSRYAGIFARLGDANSALEAVTAAVRGMAMSNLIFSESDWRGMGIGSGDVWAAYTVEPNMGVTAALTEMILQSNSTTVMLLPAVNDLLAKGEVNGLLTRVGAEIVSLSWDKRKGVVIAKIKARKNIKINVVLPSGAKKFKQIGSESVDYEQGLVSNLDLPGGKTVVLDIRL
ncbi:MAG: glycoside hydrolase family 95 protein [Clostridiales bacterium]|jgi:alpha-L-fucosidase 2|nr:glycoside hydrolase family 95 protein [Clostridiales bacterium]